MRTLQDIQQEQSRLDLERRETEWFETEFQKCCDRFKWLSRSQATREMILEYHNNKVFDFTVESFQMLLDCNPAFQHAIGGAQTHQDQQNTRLDIIARLDQLLDKALPQQPMQRQFELRRRFGNLTVDQLLQKEIEITETRKNAGKTVEQLREELKQHAQATQPQRYSPLPSELIPPGKVRGVPWSFTLIRKLSETEGGRRFVQSLFAKYSEAAITEACRRNQIKGAN
jgi:hypothetical protein